MFTQFLNDFYFIGIFILPCVFNINQPTQHEKSQGRRI